MNSSDWTPSEKWVVEWQFGLLGDFHEALAQCLARADEENFAKLRAGFPLESQGLLEWRHSGLATRLRAAGLDV